MHGLLVQDALDNLRWGADYLMACHPTPSTYIAQIGDPSTDHSYWGRQAGMVQRWQGARMPLAVLSGCRSSRAV